MTTAIGKDKVEILVVEDSPTQAEKLKCILEEHGYMLSVVRNGRQALVSIAQRPPTLVISDIIMPEMGGYELCRQIKQGAAKKIPVILLTSLSDPTDVVKGLESGADSFIFKPYDEQYLLARVAYTLANRHLRESEFPQMGVEIYFAGRKFFITSDRLQILNLLLTTYEAAVQKNRDLASTQDELRHLNENLEEKVNERTAALEAEIVERKQIESKLHAQLDRLNLLHQITRAIGERQDLRSIFQVLIQSLEENLPLDFCCIALHEPEENVLRVSCVGARSLAVAPELAVAEHATIPIDQNGLARCMQGHLVYEPHTMDVQFPFSQGLARSGLRSLIAAPLLVESKVFGVLIAARREVRGFSGDECAFLRQLSEHVALAAHQAQLYNSLQQAYDDLRQSQQAVLQQERLSALGQMASGIAHDINNAISPVSLYTEALLEKEPGLSDRGRNYLKTIQQAIDDVASTVSRMREFYRQRETQLALLPVDLNKLMEQVAGLSRARWNDMPQQQGIQIELENDLAPELPRIMGIESEIREALINLIFNAVDAMDAGGTLTLRTRLDAGDDAAVPRRIFAEVADTGHGMDETTRRRCLEPFFTTKGERGTGLGLAMVYGTARRHNAEVEIDSAPGLGTTMRIKFPVAAAPAVAEADRSEVVPALTTRLRLLVVDDDPILTKSLRDALEMDGHVVTSAGNGQEGIDAFTASIAGKEPFAAVITDLGMPRVDGRKVASAVKSLSPNTPVILLTGWGQRLVAEGDIPPHTDCVLNKPPKLKEIRDALARLCGRTPEAAKL